MASVRIATQSVWEDTSLVVMARIRGNDGANILQANVTSIAGHVYDLESDSPGSTDLWNGTLTVADVVFDTLQQTADDPRWTIDTTGFNFLVAIPATAFPDHSKYAVEIIFVPITGDNFPLAFKVQSDRLFSS